jgi:hypothetical protein
MPSIIKKKKKMLLRLIIEFPSSSILMLFTILKLLKICKISNILATVILHKVHVVLFYHYISNDNQIQVVSNFDITAFYGYEIIIFQKFEISKTQQ